MAEIQTHTDAEGAAAEGELSVGALVTRALQVKPKLNTEDIFSGE